MAASNKNKETSFIYYIFRVVIFLINSGTAIFACRIVTKSQFKYKLYTGLWVVYLTVIIFYSLFCDMKRVGLSIGKFINFLLYVSQIQIHLVILLESFVMSAKREEIVQMYIDFEKRFNKELPTMKNNRLFKQSWLLTILSFVALLATAFHTILSCTVYQVTVIKSRLYWLALPSALALEFRILELIVAIAMLNEFASTLRGKFNEMGEKNMHRVFGPYLRGERSLRKTGIVVCVKPKLYQQSSEEDDERKLRAYKKLYDDLYIMFRNVNDTYGWSLLAFMIMYFIHLVIHSYGAFFGLTARLKGHTVLENDVQFVIIFLLLLWILCWQSQVSHEHGRQIGCMMYKLVKPLGDKSYNNLVTNFSLQTLHQQYIITAKEFFNLNLNLLGSMMASIVTYLVILIQFKSTEEGKAEQAQMVTSLVAIENSISD